MLQPPFSELMILPKKFPSVFLLMCLIFDTKDIFRTVFFFEQKIQFPPEEVSGLEIPTLDFSDSKALENMVP